MKLSTVDVKCRLSWSVCSCKSVTHQMNLILQMGDLNHYSGIHSQNAPHIFSSHSFLQPMIPSTDFFLLFPYKVPTWLTQIPNFLAVVFCSSWKNQQHHKESILFDWALMEKWILQRLSHLEFCEALILDSEMINLQNFIPANKDDIFISQTHHSTLE